MIKVLLGVLAVFAASICSADPDLSSMAIVRDADIKWTESPRAPGLSMAVIYGDPAMPRLYIIRAKEEEVTLQITGIGPSATRLVDESGQLAK